LLVGTATASAVDEALLHVYLRAEEDLSQRKDALLADRREAA
jgi:hypothetical protein